MFVDSHPRFHHLHLGISRPNTKLDRCHSHFLIIFGCLFEYIMYYEMEIFVLNKWSYKVEGAKTNTPPKTNTYKHLSSVNTLPS